uniref:ATP synthase F0 subunit 8 n=1 Tax=Photinus signaticollis TaxID=3018954 RepID=UPI0023AB1EFD|nr:ATP synthase F0 subunit 8 [Photinus signaticollis]WCD24458.1 ATP synthase F0 subunit 8 [Photinus signaticollis]
MPQMAPLNWLMIFFYFCSTLMMYNVMIYTIFYYKKNNIKKIELKKFSWKW